jgi:hypothetical protein
MIVAIAVLMIFFLPIVPVHYETPPCPPDILCDAIRRIAFGWCYTCGFTCQGNGLAPFLSAIMGWDFLVIDLQAPCSLELFCIGG